MEVEITEKVFTVQLTVSELELIHLEAAVDSFTALDDDVAKGYLGKYKQRYDYGVAATIHSQLSDLRDEL